MAADAGRTMQIGAMRTRAATSIRRIEFNLRVNEIRRVLPVKAPHSSKIAGRHKID